MNVRLKGPGDRQAAGAARSKRAEAKLKRNGIRAV